MNAPDQSHTQEQGQALNSELFVPDAFDTHERLRAAEEFIYGESTGFLGEPRMVSLCSSNANYNHFTKLVYDNMFANRTLTSGYLVRAKEGPHSDPHDNFRICICVSGGVAVQTNRGQEQVFEGDVYINYSRNYQLCYSEGEYSRVIIPKMLMTGLEDAQDAFLILRSNDPVAGLVRTAAQGCSESYQDGQDGRARLASDLIVTISQRLLESYVTNTLASGYDHIRDQAIAYIQDNLHRAELSIDEVVQYANVSRATLYRAFETLGGLREFVTSERIARARSMLRLGRTHRGHVATVAYSTGFTSPERFSKVFKQKTGLSPTQFVEAGLS
ncbi:MAG: AraC family transcriptional regulator [Pseudomonadota bacterium]